MKKVFICWSGARAKHVAQGLFKWLPDVIQNVEPWMSAESVAAGARFNREVELRLEQTDFGILCITPENTGAPWIHYEAGALSKNVDVSRVIPYLIGMQSVSEVPDGPLTRFQAKLALTETFDVVKSLNEAMGAEALATDRLDRQYQRAWPDLERILKTAPIPADASPAPDSDQMISEILETVRDLARRTPVENSLGYDLLVPGSSNVSSSRLMLAILESHPDLVSRHIVLTAIRRESDGVWRISFEGPNGKGTVKTRNPAGLSIGAVTTDLIPGIIAVADSLPGKPKATLTAASNSPDQASSGET